MSIQPGTRVTVTIEATFLQENNGGYVHLAYGRDGEHALTLTPLDFRNGGIAVTAGTRAR